MTTQDSVVVGDTIGGKYVVEAVLGRGGMGLVVSARHVELEELFAIKLLLPEALQEPVAVERFLREARAAARLKGEHVARVVDVARQPDGLPFMVMEHLDGTDLKQHLTQSGPLPPMAAVEYLIQTTKAINEAHGRGIVHRDLKPANLFLAKRPDGPPAIKVLDFGISKQINTPFQGSDQDLTRTGTIVGSPFYIAPERMRRGAEADPRSDIWSLGVILFELLTGRKPFEAASYSELVLSIVQDSHIRLTSILPDLLRSNEGAELERIIDKCLQKQPDNRYQTATELLAALDAVFIGRASTTGQSALFEVRALPPQAAPVPLSSSSSDLVRSSEVHGRPLPAPFVGGAAQPAAPITVAAATVPNMPLGGGATSQLPLPDLPKPAQPPVADADNSNTLSDWGTTSGDRKGVAASFLPQKRKWLVVAVIACVSVVAAALTLLVLVSRDGPQNTTTEKTGEDAAASTVNVTSATASVSASLPVGSPPVAGSPVAGSPVAGSPESAASASATQPPSSGAGSSVAGPSVAGPSTAKTSGPVTTQPTTKTTRATTAKTGDVWDRP